jgi:lycopene beta-cyclase
MEIAPTSQIPKADYLIAGGGCSGLSLAWHILQEPLLKEKSIIIIEKEQKSANDRTWCFWEKGEGPFEAILEKVWSNAWFYAPGLEKNLHMAPYHYKMIRSAAYYEFIQNYLKGFENVRVIQAEISALEESASGVSAFGLQGELIAEGHWGFSSIRQKTDFLPGHSYLEQHFKGWFIETGSPTFDPDQATLMDFRIPQHGDCRFMYILPVSPTQALVEYTVFSGHLLEPTEYDKQLKHYLDSSEIKSFKVLHEEFGVIPMYSQAFKLNSGARIWNLGTAGGRSKGSTGYTFTRIQRHSVFLARSLAETGKPAPYPNPWRFWFYDAVLLRVLRKGSVPAWKVFKSLFKYNKPHQVFSFLDEDTHWLLEYKILNTVPIFGFLGPAFQILAQSLAGLFRKRK